MKVFNSFLCVFMFLTASITSCTEKDIPTPSTASSTSTADNPNYREDEPIVIRGHVKNTSGGNIIGASANLFVAGTSTSIRSTTTDSNGQFSMSALSSGSYVLKLAASGYQNKDVNITLTTSNITRTDTLMAQ